MTTVFLSYIYSFHKNIFKNKLKVCSKLRKKMMLSKKPLMRVIPGPDPNQFGIVRIRSKNLKEENFYYFLFKDC